MALVCLVCVALLSLSVKVRYGVGGPLTSTATVDLLHLPARITFGTWTSVWTSLPLWERRKVGLTADIKD